jgi:hypothetical protein
MDNNQNDQFNNQGQQNYDAQPQQTYNAQPQDSYQNNSYQNNNYQSAGTVEKPPMEKKELGIISLVLGCLGIITMCCYGTGILFGIAAIILGKISLNANQGRDVAGVGIAKAGFITGIIATAISVITIVIVIIAFVSGSALEFTDYMY